ncbi:MAG: hypothetical protein HY289_11520 [Planctomycetes bacterium]|nr:hypothetical protein [Planctomycetota bacterium]
MVILRLLNLHWINNEVDDRKDLCAHGDVDFRIDSDILLGANGKDLTVSAAALYLLRTLSRPHTKEAPVGDQLFPCCGFAMWDLPGQDDVALSGCPNGEDFEVCHDTSGAGVVVRAADGRAWQVKWSDWRNAVFAFADQVSAFYAHCSPKEPTEEDLPGFNKFKEEWQRRRGTTLSVPSTNALKGSIEVR